MARPLRFVLDESLGAKLMAWMIGVEGLRAGDSGEGYRRLEEVAAEWAEREAGQSPGQIAGVRLARRLYRDFGVDPTRTRPSSEALLRRALRRQRLYRINDIVDVGNWVSLEFLLPVGLYDRDAVQAETAIVRVGRGGEEFAGIRKGPVHVEGRLCVSDALGPFGSPTSDSLRTSIRAETRNVAAILFAPAGAERERLEQAGTALGERLVSVCGGAIQLSELLVP